MQFHDGSAVVMVSGRQAAIQAVDRAIAPGLLSEADACSGQDLADSPPSIASARRPLVWRRFLVSRWRLRRKCFEAVIGHHWGINHVLGRCSSPHSAELGNMVTLGR